MSHTDEAATPPVLSAAADSEVVSQGVQKRWNQMLAPYKQSDNARATFQVVTSALAFGLLWAAMLLSLQWSYLWTLLLALPASGMLVRLFIIQHDCGHGSFFSSRRANDTLGSVLGIMTLTPYHYWRRTHAIHHATSGNLDKRGFGDVNTITVNEYRALSPGKRFAYRFYRNSLTLLLIGPIFVFVLKHRFPLDAPRTWKKEWTSVMTTNVGLVVLVTAMGMLLGFDRFLLVQVPITLISGVMGVWLFYVQHQFEDTYWEKEETWDYHTASVRGSSFYDLPRILHWFTGNIGFHHIHHLSSLIPNYRLQQCMREIPELQQVGRMGFWKSLGCARLKLWDEASGKLVGYRELRSS